MRDNQYRDQPNVKRVRAKIARLITTVDHAPRGTFMDLVLDDGTEINVPTPAFLPALFHAKDNALDVELEYGHDPGPNGPNRLLSVEI